MSGQPSLHADVTAVIPCFNYGAFLSEAVGSLLAQQGGAPQIIVVDDGSTDAQTAEALAALPECVTVIRQENQGMSGARNTGVRASSTPLFITLDADDRLPPDALVTLRAPLDATDDERLGWSYGTMRFFGDWEGEIRFPPFDPYRLLYRHIIGVTALTRRELFDDIGGWDPELRGFEDWEFWLHAIESGWHGVKVDAVTIDYRRHGPTVLASARRDYRHWYRALRRKRSALYARRAQLARASTMSAAERALYRWYWGPRPIPAALEHRLYALVFRGPGTG